MPPLLGSVPLDVEPPRLENLSTEYLYTTVAGRYAFSKDRPYLMRHESVAGEGLVAASTFAVLSPGVTPFVAPAVLNVSSYRYAVRYSLREGGTTVGNVSITYDFFDTAAPKVTAQLERPGNSSLVLSWVSLTLDGVAFNGTATIDFRSIDPAVEIETPNHRVFVGPAPDPNQWGRRLTLDWSDAGVGTTFVGRVSVGDLQGAAVLVKFPEEMTVVDPSITGTSTTAAATDFPIQRKTFSYGDRFWVFWYDGEKIVYASSSIHYANSQSWMTWTAKMSTASGPLPQGSGYRGFDVAQEGALVLVGYIPFGGNQLAGLAGTITGSFITWQAPFGIASWGVDAAGIPSVGIGTDGFLWGAVTWGSPTVYAEVYRSGAPGALSFSLSTSTVVSGTAADTAFRLVLLSNGTLLAIRSTKGASTIVTQRYTSSGWGMSNTHDIELPVAETRGGILTTLAATSDDVHVVFKGDDTTAPGIRHVVVTKTDNLVWKPALDTSLSQDQPTIANDANGDLHAFWRKVDSPAQYRVKYSRQRPDGSGWEAPTEPWSSTGDFRAGLVTGIRATNQAFVVWTQGATSPYNVQFGSIPTPLDLGSQTGQPWNRQGISPYQSYFRQLGEFVSPGSGLLTIKQTDLVLPGRNLDLEISRVFVTPRAFTTTGTASPYLYEDYPASNLGKGWRLNFPWISSQYVHLWDGQMYVLRWQGTTPEDSFENHDGEHFTLKRYCNPSCYGAYTLFTKGGIRFEFDGSRQLIAIKDSTGNNVISFTYASGKIDYATDTIGRIVDFAHNPDGTLLSVTSGSRTISYSYQTVSGLTMLASVRDPIGRETRFEHTYSGNPYLMTAVRYPTGMSTIYSWTTPAVQIASDLYSYYVTLQDTVTPAGSARSTTFDYTVLNGRVSYVRATAYDQGVAKGSTVYHLDVLGTRSSMVRQDALGNQIAKDVTWFGAGGAVGQVDFHPGASTDPAYSEYVSHDDWGNVIYSRDAIGHERFASYVNTDTQGGFRAPGRLTRTTTGLLFFDDFEDRDPGSCGSDWCIDQSAGSVALDYTTFESLPPSLKIAHGGAPSSAPSAAHGFPAQPGFVVVEAVVRAEEANKHHQITMSSSNGVRAWVSLDPTGQISWSTTGTSWTPVAPYSPGHWYRLAFGVNLGSNSYDLWINGVVKASQVPFAGSGDLNQVRFQASCSGCGSATMFVDAVKVYKSAVLYVSGLQPGQVVRFVNLEGFKSASAQMPAGPESVILSLAPGSFPYGVLIIYDLEGTPEFTSPSRMFWGGEVWAYTPPWKKYPFRAQAGFLRAAQVYVDDDFPSGCGPGCIVSAEDGWDWGEGVDYNYPVSDAPPPPPRAHRSKYLTGTHQHYFQDAGGLITYLGGEYHIQYVYVPENQYPSEIMLQFRDTGNSFEHRAFWGADLIQLWGTNGTNSRRWMGGLPKESGRWLMMIAKADDVGTNGLNVEGWAYTLYGGTAAWDFSARGDSQTGEIRVNSLQANQRAELYDRKGTLVATGTTNGISVIDLYGAASKIRAFPFEGYLVVLDTSNAGIYRSPQMTLWGGDIYNFQLQGTSFYPNVDVDPTIHDRMAAVLEYQTGRGASPEVPQEAYVRYTSQGLPDRVKVYDVGGGQGFWRETSISYDGTYGLPTTVTDPKLNQVSYSYSQLYSKAYVTQVTNDYGYTERFAYDPTTGWLLADKDRRNYRSQYAYDPLGRSTSSARFDLPTSSEALYFDMEWATEEPSPRMDDLSGSGNPGTITGTQTVAGRVGLGRDFVSSTDIITAADSPSLSLTSSLTLTAWVRYDTLPTSDFAEILRKYDTSNNGYIFDVHTTGADTKKLRFVLGNGGANVYKSTKTLDSSGRFYHIAVVFDSVADSVTFYVDGAPAGSATGVTTNAADNTWALSLGKDPSSTLRTWDGVLDEIRAFSRALGASEVASLFTNTYGLLASDETAYDDGANVLTYYEPTVKARALHLDMETFLGTKLEDFAGRGYPGSAVGTTAFAGGAIGGAQDFDGTDDSVEVPDGPALDLTEAMTVSFWIRHDYATNPTDVKGIFFKGETTGPGHRNYAGWLDTSRKLVMAWGDSPPLVQSATALTDTSKWYHVAMVFNWTGDSFQIYVDAGPPTSVTSGADSTSNAGKLVLGKMSEASPASQFLDGKIDEFQVINRALTASEVTALFQSSEKGSYLRQYFDPLGRATKVLRRDFFNTMSSSESYTYNFRDQVLTHLSARGFTTTYAYDFLGRLTSGMFPETAQPFTIAHDDINRIRTLTAENGRKTEYLSDLAGRTTSVREYYDATNYHTTSYAYDEVGNLVSVANGLGQVTTHTYDILNRLTKTTYPDTTKYEEYTYDEVGNLKTRRDRAAQVTTYLYDDLYRLTTIDYPGTDQDAGFTYDPNDNPLTATNPTATVAYTYDGLDRVRTETDTITGTAYNPVVYGYDAAGRLLSLTYPDNYVVDYGYDLVGRTKDVRSGSTTFASFAYFADDLLKDVNFDNGITQSLTYNGRAWPTSIRATWQSSTYLDLSYSSYDPSGNILTIGGTTQATQTFTYDKLDRLKTASGGFGSQTFTYDALGNRLTLDGGEATLRPNGATSTTQWSKSGTGGANWDRVDEPSPHDGDGTYVFESTVGDTDLYALTNLGPFGAIEAVTVHAVAKSSSRPSCTPECLAAVKLRVNGYASPVLYAPETYTRVSHTWTTNPATGQPWTSTEVDALQAGVEKASDGLGLTAYVTQLYVMVNDDTATHAYSNGPTGMNQLTSMTRRGVTTFFTYDANGNLDTKTGGWDYDWNSENLMTFAKISGAQQQAYVYDGLGRRVKVEGTSSSTWTVSIYSGMDVIFEKTNTGAVTKYVYANGMRIAKITSTGTVHYFLADHLGSTRKILDSARIEQYSVEYEPFGKPYAALGPQPDKHKYTMEKHDDPTGLVYLRARQYDPETGRFVSADPILGSALEPQTQNRYSYVTNNPVKFFDPTGQCGEAPPWWADLLTLGIAGLPNALSCTVEWWNRASDAERWGFVAGVVTAVLVGVAIGALCAATLGVGCLAVALAWGASAVLLGTMAGILAYAYTTRALGGTPTTEGVAHVAYWGAWGSGLGFAGGMKVATPSLRPAMGQPREPPLRVIRGTAEMAETGGPRNAMYLRTSPDGSRVWHMMRFDAEGRMMWRLDLVGRPHAGVPTPHLHIVYDPVFGNQVGRVFRVTGIAFWT